MAKHLISVTGQELLFDAKSASIKVSAGGTATLCFDFQVFSDQAHANCSAWEKANKREIELKSTGKGISVEENVKVLTEEVNGTTRFRVEVPIIAKVPNSGSLTVAKKRKG